MPGSMTPSTSRPPSDRPCSGPSRDWSWAMTPDAVLLDVEEAHGGAWERSPARTVREDITAIEFLNASALESKEYTCKLPIWIIPLPPSPVPEAVAGHDGGACTSAWGNPSSALYELRHSRPPSRPGAGPAHPWQKPWVPSRTGSISPPAAPRPTTGPSTAAVRKLRQAGQAHRHHRPCEHHAILNCIEGPGGPGGI